MAALLAGGCHSQPASDGGVPDAADPCAALFGNPEPATGLDTSACHPSCSCGGVTFTPPTYDHAFIQSLIDDWQLDTPYSPLATDPYSGPAPAPPPDGAVCAMVPLGAAADHPRRYRLDTFQSEAAARARGAAPTHFGPCGVCSPLSDLAVYMRYNDLTAPARACALSPASDGGDAQVACLMALGFDIPCAQAWAFDANNTRKNCLTICVAHFTDSYNDPDGALNPCLQCDEDKSGAVFKSVAGRTRRNCGLPNAICRPCSQVKPLVHRYP